MTWTPRLQVWLLCGISAVFLSSQPAIREKLVLFADEWYIPPWLYLLPISLTVAWLIAQSVFLGLNMPRVSPKGKAVFITGQFLVWDKLICIPWESTIKHLPAQYCQRVFVMFCRCSLAPVRMI